MTTKDEDAARELRRKIAEQERRVLDAAHAWEPSGINGTGLRLALEATALRALYAQRDGTVAP